MCPLQRDGGADPPTDRGGRRRGAMGGYGAKGREEEADGRVGTENGKGRRRVPPHASYPPFGAGIDK